MSGEQNRRTEEAEAIEASRKAAPVKVKMTTKRASKKASR